MKNTQRYEESVYSKELNKFKRYMTKQAKKA